MSWTLIMHMAVLLAITTNTSQPLVIGAVLAGGALGTMLLPLVKRQYSPLRYPIYQSWST